MLFITMVLLLAACLVAFGLTQRWLTRYKKTDRSYDDAATTVLVIKWTAIVLGIAFALMSVRCFFTVIPTGHVGVQTVFGKIQAAVLHEGLTGKNPLAAVIKMTGRTQSYTMSIRQSEGDRIDPDHVRVLSSDNLEMDMDLSVLFSLHSPDAQKIYKELGDTEAYVGSVVRPSIRRAIRAVASKYTAADLMSSARGAAEKDIFTELVSSMKDYFSKKGIQIGVNCEAVLLRNVQPPDTLKAAIEDKLSKQQQKEAMEFVLETEKKKAEQRVIEARGLADSQSIIDKTLTPEYLQFKYIEALEKLVNSPNNTILVLPFDQKLTPLINVGK